MVLRKRQCRMLLMFVREAIGIINDHSYEEME
jgi:hypothetical protein